MLSAACCTFNVPPREQRQCKLPRTHADSAAEPAPQPCSTRGSVLCVHALRQGATVSTSSSDYRCRSPPCSLCSPCSLLSFRLAWLCGLVCLPYSVLYVSMYDWTWLHVTCRSCCCQLRIHGLVQGPQGGGHGRTGRSPKNPEFVVMQLMICKTPLLDYRETFKMRRLVVLVPRGVRSASTVPLPEAWSKLAAEVSAQRARCA